MGTVSVSLPSDGQTIDAADYNVPINTIVAAINGNLDSNNLADDAVTAAKVDFGGSGSGIWWEEIGRTTLSGAGDTITVNNIPARKYLKVMFSGLNTGGTIDAAVTFNNDTGSNYRRRVSDDGGADAVGSAAANLSLTSTATAAPKFVSFEAINISAQEKLILGHSVDQGTAGSANPPSRREIQGKWANTSAQITRIDIVSAGTGDFAIGSEMVVMGHN